MARMDAPRVRTALSLPVPPLPGTYTLPILPVQEGHQMTLRPFSEWKESMGAVLWYSIPPLGWDHGICSFPYVGEPTDADFWVDTYTHFTPIPRPTELPIHDEVVAEQRKVRAFIDEKKRIRKQQLMEDMKAIGREDLCQESSEPLA